MTRDDLDRTLRRLRDAAERISDNLLDLELDEIRMALDATELAGESEARWREAGETLQRVWQWYGALDDLLKRADEVRGTRTRMSDDQSAELTALLTGQSITYRTDNVPIQRRELLGASVATARCTPDELLTRMSAGFDEVKAVVAAVQSVWETLRSRALATRAALEQNAQRFAELGLGELADFEPLRRSLDQLAEQIAQDPLAVDDAAVGRLEAAVAAFQTTLDELRALPERLDQTRALIERAHQVAREGREAHAEVKLKIVAPAVPAPLEHDSLDAELEQVVALARDGAWKQAADTLDRCTEHAALRLERAAQVVAENRAPIARRNELRGLLDAYCGKARRLGLIEDPHVARLFAAAQAVLYRAPTDLEYAGELVRRYADALSDDREVLL